MLDGGPNQQSENKPKVELFEESAVVTMEGHQFRTERTLIERAEKILSLQERFFEGLSRGLFPTWASRFLMLNCRKGAAIAAKQTGIVEATRVDTPSLGAIRKSLSLDVALMVATDKDGVLPMLREVDSILERGFSPVLWRLSDTTALHSQLVAQPFPQSVHLFRIPASHYKKIDRLIAEGTLSVNDLAGTALIHSVLACGSDETEVLCFEKEGQGMHHKFRYSLLSRVHMMTAMHYRTEDPDEVMILSIAGPIDESSAKPLF